uniref:Murine leukemia virus integrase C-terminal domain-containing protein n=1 Tax=Amphiprion percula TaxID=161767 RepID=A0A3P8THQ1_AMPPE
VTSGQKQEEVQEKLDEQKKDVVQPGDKVFVKVFRRKWFNERREGPFEVVRSTGTAVQVKRSPTWYHLSHCVKAPQGEVPRLQSRDDEDSRVCRAGFSLSHSVKLLYC